MHTENNLIIAYQLISKLQPYPRNARTHSKKQIRQIAKSIETFGFTNPVLTDDQNMILAGHGRVEAARLLGMTAVPTVTLSSMTAAQKRAYVLADNKLALNAGWDNELLAVELQELLVLDGGFDITSTGFEIGEADALIEGLRPEDAGDPADEKVPSVEKVAISRPGDIWLLGPHKLLCGSALDEGAFRALMGEERAEMVFTDPPYNVRIDGHAGGLGKIRHREFAMASGEMSREQFTAFLRQAMQNLVGYSTDGSIHFHCMDWRHLQEILRAGEEAYTELKNVCVWVKDNGGMGTFYRSRHELVLAFKNGRAPHINSFELGQHGRYRTNVWNYRGATAVGRERNESLAIHPTVKPVAMIADAMKDVSRRGGLVLDGFGGSGSTLIAAHKTGRRARLIELDPLYVDVAIRRWQKHAKDDAVLAAGGSAFTEVVEERIQRGGVR